MIYAIKMNKRNTMSKKLLILFLATILIGFTFSQVMAVDWPHNEQMQGGKEAIGCDKCHFVFGTAESLLPPWITYDNTPPNIDNTHSNALCWSCHNDDDAPFVRTHSSQQIDNSYSDWTVECEVCHWPHDHQQSLVYGSNAYIFSGNSTGISGTELEDNDETWGIDQFKDMLLIPNTGQQTTESNRYMYRILSNTNTTIAVEGNIDLTKASPGNQYAVIYGKLVRSTIDVLKITDQNTAWPPDETDRTVEFFNNSGGPDSFADGAAPFNGICEVCHRETQKPPLTGIARYRYNEHTDTHNEGTNCTSCHLHLEGMSPEGACNVCHGFPPIEDVANTSSTDGINGLVDNPGTTGSLHAGKHDFHVNTMGYSDCNFCHYNSVGSGPTHDPGAVEEITLGFSLFTGGIWQGGTYDGQDVPGQVPLGYNFTATVPATTVTNNINNNRTCTNIYCHSIVQTNGGGALVFGNAAHWQTPAPVWDTASGSISCGSCHLNPPLTGRHVTKHLADYAANIDCNTCHEGGGYKRLDGPDTEHASGAIDVFINNITSQDGLIDYGTGTYTGTPVAQDGYGSCESVYCHSNAQSSPTYVNRPWDTSTTMPADCTGCHNNNVAAAAEMDSGAHNTHINDSDSEVGRNLPCITCHEATVDNTDRAIIDFAKHVNKTKDIDINVTGETDCNNIQCHSDGNFDGTIVHNNPNWNPDILGCVDCHGDGGTQAYPSYADGGTGTGDANSHNAHVGTSGINCVQCHDDTSTVGTSIDGATPSVHVNQVVDVVFDQGGTYHEALPLPGSGDADDTCSATYCHGAGKSPAWGNTAAALDCDQCHSGSGNTLPNTHPTHYDSGATIATSADFTPNNNSTTTNYIFTCGVCHEGTSHAAGPVTPGVQAAEVIFNAAIAGPGSTHNPGAVSPTDDKGFNFTQGTCTSTYCHSDGDGGAGNVTPQWEVTVVDCESCHNYNAGATNKMSSGTHTAHMNDGTIMSNKTCDTCHVLTTVDEINISDKSLHVNTTKDVTINNTYDSDTIENNNYADPNCSNIKCHSDGKSAPNYVASVQWGGPAIGDCVSCHGGPGGAAGGAGTSLTVPHTRHTDTGSFAYTCTSCHNTVASNNTTISGPALHVNMARNVFVSGTHGGDGADWTGTNCSTTDCHGTTSPTWAASGSLGDCSLCHGMVTDPTDDRDTSGNANDNTDPEIGAHEAHLNATHTLSLAIACNECHIDPNETVGTYEQKVNTANHNDDALPAEVPLLGTLANDGTATPSYSGAPGGTCSTTYCHDGTTFDLGYSTAVQIEFETPDWNTPIMAGDATDCDNCHGYPPDPPHPAPAIDCTSCHDHVNATNDGFKPQGTPVTGGVEEHVNGALEVQADCDNCHGYPPTPGDGHPNQAVEGKGAHATHVDHLEQIWINQYSGSARDKANDVFGVGTPGFICGACHTNTAAGNHQVGDRNINFDNVNIYRFTNSGSPTYNGTVGTPGATLPAGTYEKTCSNVSCHFTETPEWHPY
jgi:predicted CxxxxCH...CXXCH cytochrome family protein